MSQVSRGRDVMDIMKKRGEQGVRECIIKLAEDNTMLHHELRELAQVVHDVIQQMAMQIGVMKEYQSAMEKMQAKFYPDNEANPNQKWS